MKSNNRDSAQAMQRVRVGMTGLATVLVMIGLASAIFTSANREAPVSAVGAPNSSIVANMTDDSSNAIAAKTNEPLAELGVAPSTTTAEAATPAKTAETDPQNGTDPAQKR